MNLLEGADVVLGEILVGEVRERSTGPDVDSLLEFGCSARDVSAPNLRKPLPDQPFEAKNVDRVRWSVQGVPGCPGLDERRPVAVGESLAEVRHIELNGVFGSARRGLAPNLLDDLVDRHDLVGVKQQNRQHGALLGRAQFDRPGFGFHGQWTKKAELHRSPSSSEVRLRRGRDTAKVDFTFSL
jgi:hypothetical protein